MTTTTLDPAVLVTAIEERDSATLTNAYATDAIVTIVDRDHPPATPRVLTGKAQIETYYRDICGRNLDHSVPAIVAHDGVLAFEQHCRYPDGTAVLCLTVAETRDGLITHQTIVQAWD